MKVKVVNKSKNSLPIYETEGAAAIDLKIDLSRTPELILDEDGRFYLPYNQRILLKTGLFVEIPEGYELQIRSRSGLAFKNGVIILNSPGTIDSDYRGEIGLIIYNSDFKDGFYIKDGDRLAQALLKKVEKIEWEKVEKLEETDRGVGGFGHTGVK
jgi:dUTP pyrophosphatase